MLAQVPKQSTRDLNQYFSSAGCHAICMPVSKSDLMTLVLWKRTVGTILWTPPHIVKNIKIIVQKWFIILEFPSCRTDFFIQIALKNIFSNPCSFYQLLLIFVGHCKTSLVFFCVFKSLLFIIGGPCLSLLFLVSPHWSWRLNPP